METALAVAGDDPLRIESGGPQQAIGRHIGGAHADEGQPQALQRLADDPGGVDEGGENDGRGALLVVMPDRNVQLPAKGVEDSKALGLGDVLEVDPAEARLEQLDGPHNLVRVLGSEAEGNRIDPTQVLEQQGLALHHRQGGLRPDVTETEYPAAVRDDGDAVGLVAVLEYQGRVGANRTAGRRHARAVPNAEVFEPPHRAFRKDLHLAAVIGMKAQGFLPRPFGVGQKLRLAWRIRP